MNTYNASDNLGFTTSAGITQETGDFNNLLNVATHVAPGQTNIDQGGALTATQFRNKFQNDGIFIQEEALIKDAITLTGGVRFDRSTNNGDANKFYTYPKAGVSMNLTHLGVLDQSFNNLKVACCLRSVCEFPGLRK